MTSPNMTPASRPAELTEDPWQGELPRVRFVSEDIELDGVTRCECCSEDTGPGRRSHGLVGCLSCWEDGSMLSGVEADARAAQRRIEMVVNPALGIANLLAAAAQAIVDQRLAEHRVEVYFNGSLPSTPDATRDAIVAGLKLPRPPLPVYRNPRTEAAVIDALNPNRRRR